MYTDNREAYRDVFFAVWQKHLKQLPLEPMEKQLIEVILLHPEYRTVLEDPATFQRQEFTPEENPFIHLSLHMTVREQIQLDRPIGVKQIYQTWCEQQTAHDAEHKMMMCLAQLLWKAQETGQPPDEKDYLTALQST